MTRTRCAARFARRSSSIANTVVWSSAATTVASPCSAAMLAAAAASMTLVLRRLPRDNSRTRAVAAKPASIFDGPSSFRERLGPSHQLAIARQCCVDTHRRCCVVRCRVHGVGRVRHLVGIDPDNHVLCSLLSHSWMGRAAPGMPTFRPARTGSHLCCARPPPVDGREANPGRANPKVAGASRANPTNDLPDTTNHSTHHPASSIQVGASVTPVEQSWQAR